MRFFAARLHGGDVVERHGPYASRREALNKIREQDSGVRDDREVWAVQAGAEA